MRVTTQGEYGLRCMICIGKNQYEGPVSIQKISQEEDLPRTYVEQLLLKLRRHGLIQSVRGARGGYRLAKDSKDISVSEIIMALEGNVFEVVCDRRRKSRNKCKYDGTCVLNVVWKEIQSAIESVLGTLNLHYLVQEELKIHPPVR